MWVCSQLGRKPLAQLSHPQTWGHSKEPDWIPLPFLYAFIAPNDFSSLLATSVELLPTRRLEIGNQSTSADKRVFQVLESPGKTKKGKHQINRENGSCQHASTSHNVHAGQRARHQAQQGNEKYHLSNANKKRREKTKNRQVCPADLKKKKVFWEPCLCQHFSTGSFHHT